MQRIVREALGSPHVDSRRGGTVERRLWLELARPRLATRISDLDRADAIFVVDADPLHSMPILDLRIRKALRRNRTRLAVASPRPTALDGGAAEAVRYAPGEAAGFLADLAVALGRRAASAAPRAYRAEAEAIASVLAGAGDVVIVWGDGLAGDPGGGLQQLLAVARALELGERDGSGLLEVPRETNARGLREVGCLPDVGPGYSAQGAGSDAAGIRAGLESGELASVMLVNADPVRDHPDANGWRRALDRAGFVLACSMFRNESTSRADVVFPAESYAEKEGTVTHPDGRLQKLRPGIPHPGEVRMGWEVLVELSAALGRELELDSCPMVLEELAGAVPFYAGITTDEIGGTGIRWQERGAARGLPAPPRGAATAPKATAHGQPRDSRLRLGTYRDLWAGGVPERNPVLGFLVPAQTLELAPADAERLGLGHGAEAEVRSNGASVRARVAVRSRMRPGAGFLIEGTSDGNANVLGDAETVEVTPAE